MIKYFLTGLLTVAGLLLVGCSGGGGGGGGQPSAEYTGSTTQVSLTANNSQDMNDAAIDGAAPAGSMVASADTAPTGNKSQMLGFVKQIAKLRVKLEQEKENGNYNTFTPGAAVQTSSDTTTSPCGGSMTMSFSIDDQTFEWSGSVSFSNFKDCDTSSTMNGSLSFSGNLSATTYTFNAMTYTDASESFTLTGTMDMAGIPGTNGGNFTITLNVDFRDNNANETYRMRNVVMSMVDYTTYSTIDISGTIYHHSHGYVTVSTDAGNLINQPFDSDYPTSGIMYLTGSGGSKTTVTYLSNGTYTLDIDTNGDTIIDNSLVCTWSTGQCV